MSLQLGHFLMQLSTVLLMLLARASHPVKMLVLANQFRRLPLQRAMLSDQVGAGVQRVIWRQLHSHADSNQWTTPLSTRQAVSEAIAA